MLNHAMDPNFWFDHGLKTPGISQFQTLDGHISSCPRAFEGYTKGTVPNFFTKCNFLLIHHWYSCNLYIVFLPHLLFASLTTITGTFMQTFLRNLLCGWWLRGSWQAYGANLNWIGVFSLITTKDLYTVAATLINWYAKKWMPFFYLNFIPKPYKRCTMGESCGMTALPQLPAGGHHSPRFSMCYGGLDASNSHLAEGTHIWNLVGHQMMA